MARARVSELTVDGYLSAGKRARISQVSVDGTAGAGTTKRARISRLTFVGSTATYRARISRLSFVGSLVTAMTPSLTVSAAKVEPGATVTVSAEGTQGNQVNVEFTTPAEGVVLTGSGLTRTFTAPRDWRGKIIAIQARYTDGFGATAILTTSVTVYPQQLWFLDASGTWVPVRSPFRRI